MNHMNPAFSWVEVMLLLLCRGSCVSCDCCGEAVFGRGLSVIRGVEHSHFRVKNLPFVFTVCSPKCCTVLRSRHNKYWLDESVVT